MSEATEGLSLAILLVGAAITLAPPNFLTPYLPINLYKHCMQRLYLISLLITCYSLF